MRCSFSCLPLHGGFICLLLVLGAALVHANPTAEPAVAASVGVIDGRWLAAIPPSGAVNLPDFLQTVAPNQRLLVAVITSSAAPVNPAHFRIRIGGETAPRWEFTNVVPIARRSLKAQGLDFAVVALQAAASASDMETLRERGTRSTLTVYDLGEWRVPALANDTVLELSGEISGTAFTRPTQMTLRTSDAWVGASAPATDFKRLRRFQSTTLPAERLAAWLGATEEEKRADALRGYFVASAREDDFAAAAAHAFDSFSTAQQAEVIRLLRLAGRDVTAVLPRASDALPRSAAATPAEDDARVFAPLADPVARSLVSEGGHRMDRCWGGWMATGDRTYLWAVVQHLEHAADHAAYRHWRDTKGGPAGLNAAVARGLFYEIAGWSVASFQRSDPLVADWLAYWAQDPAASPSLRQELSTMATNPAFRRQPARAKPAGSR